MGNLTTYGLLWFGYFILCVVGMMLLFVGNISGWWLMLMVLGAFIVSGLVMIFGMVEVEK